MLYENSHGPALQKYIKAVLWESWSDDTLETRLLESLTRVEVDDIFSCTECLGASAGAARRVDVGNACMSNPSRFARFLAGKDKIVHPQQAEKITFIRHLPPNLTKESQELLDCLQSYRDDQILSVENKRTNFCFVIGLERATQAEISQLVDVITYVKWQVDEFKQSPINKMIVLGVYMDVVAPEIVSRLFIPRDDELLNVLSGKLRLNPEQLKDLMAERQFREKEMLIRKILSLPLAEIAEHSFTQTSLQKLSNQNLLKLYNFSFFCYESGCSHLINQDNNLSKYLAPRWETSGIIQPARFAASGLLSHQVEASKRVEFEVYRNLICEPPLVILRRAARVLLSGPSGVGKTFILQKIAESHTPSVVTVFLPLSLIHGQYFGDSERNLRLAFADAEKHRPHPVVLVLEGLELIARKAGDAHDSLSRRLMSTLLVILDGITVSSHDTLSIVATTRVTPLDLDEAVTRPGRFDSWVEMAAHDS